MSKIDSLCIGNSATKSHTNTYCNVHGNSTNTIMVWSVNANSRNNTELLFFYGLNTLNSGPLTVLGCANNWIVDM